jgi:hypothetical protein
MSGENNIDFKSEPDNRANDLLANKALPNPRDPVGSPQTLEAVRTVANQAPPSTENPLAPQSTQIPALPILSSFFGATDAVTPDTVKGMFMDAMKNVTINGVSPNISGGSIDFNVETKSSASQQWNSANNINMPPTSLVPAPLGGYSAEVSNSASQPAPPTNQQNAPQQPVQSDDDVFSMAKPKTLKERARELEDERMSDSEGFSMAKPKSLKTDLGRNTIDDVIDQAESESKAANGGGGTRRRGKDRIFDKIEEAIENEDFDKARKLNERVKNRELETELRGEGKDRDRRSTKDIAESEGIDTKGKSSKELREEILEKRRGAAKEKEGASGKEVSDFSTVEIGKQMVELVPIPIKSADGQDKYRMMYAMTTSVLDFTVDIDEEGDSKFFETLEGENSETWANDEYYLASGAPIKFYCYKDGETGTIELSAMSKFKPTET